MTKKINLNLNGIGIRGLKERRHAASACCRNHIFVLPGYGDQNFRFPDSQTLVINALARLEQRYGSDEEEAQPQEGAESKEAATGDATESGGASQAIRLTSFRHSDHREHSQAPVSGAHERIKVKSTAGCRHKGIVKELVRKGIRFDRTFVPGMPANFAAPEPVIAKLPDAEQRNMDGTLFLAALGKAMIMDEGKYDAIVAERFDPLAGAVNWARDHMAAKYQQAIDSLASQLDKLQKLYKEALPRVLAVLAAQNPDVHPKKLEAAAVEVLDEELVQILTVLRIWTDAFAQHRDGMYKQLEAVTFVVEQAFKLQTQGRLSTGEAENIHTVVFQIGNVFVARFSNQGPATFPGTRGPIGAHAIEVPHDERKMIALMLVLYTHEFRHDIFADVEGLAAEVVHTVVSSIQQAFADGKFKFSTDKVAFGRNKFDLVDIIAKIFADTIPEVDADVDGGVLQSGPAFLYNMISSFSALNAGRPEGIMKVGQLLRPNSYYEMTSDNGQTSLDFLPHPPDYIRAYIVAAALDEIGFTAEADECRRLADQAVGSPLPKYITWSDVDGKSKAVIKIAFDDLKQVAPIVVKALIRTPLKALGGLAMFDIVNWTRHRQDKVDVLTKNLMNGSAEVPDNIGDIYGTYVAAAATLAYWGLCKSGVRPLVAAAVVEENALKMLDTVRQRQATAEAGTPEHTPCTCGRHPEETPHQPAEAPAPIEPKTE
jgi:hypothetical protein